jgi:type II secretion system protein H
MARPVVTTTSTTGMGRSDPAPGFTLVELILVMALLAVVAAFSAPSLARSLRQRNLDGEAARLIALTEYGRDEAMSQGVPMSVWVDPKAQRMGVEPKVGFDGDETRAREFELNTDIHFELDRTATQNGVVQVMEFSPDGSPSASSIDSVRLVDRFQSLITVARTSDGWAYEVVKGQR